jgi:anaphase-promoting complex subunit 10
LNAVLGSEREFRREKKREIGHLAVWSVASAKQGNGVELLRDDDLGTFWQSDGAQPHVVNAQFQHKVELCEIALWCEFKMDESYTPSMISIRAGTSCHDFKEVRCVEIFKPNGWVRIRLDRERGTVSPYLRAYFIQVAVLANHQNGRDTHVRQIKIFGPRRDQARALGRSLQLEFKSPKFTAYASVR